jgi:hypothetical protein
MLGDRAWLQLDVGSAFDAGHRVVEIVDLLVDAVDLHENVFGFRHWHSSPAAAQTAGA